jgi:hypothetical protein
MAAIITLFFSSRALHQEPLVSDNKFRDLIPSLKKAKATRRENWLARLNSPTFL